MTTLLAAAFGIHAFAIPVFGIAVLIASKLSLADKRFTESLFMAALTLVTLVTLRTVANNDPAWLTHTLTLAVMILGAVWLPSMNDIQAAKKS
ncbi:hypothetical protein [Rosistilla oblonga]|uniref:hypothetical protein n=1 Tax=Rosistilla oblonga TaxID=2527990 RepID=UPI003A96A7DE